MASDCVVAGFTGGGGREYAVKENGFWVEEDDFTGCVKQLPAAITLSRNHGPERQAHRDACRKTLEAYTPDAFTAAIRQVWAGIARP
jgi:hypothetical protein